MLSLKLIAHFLWNARNGRIRTPEGETSGHGRGILASPALIFDVARQIVGGPRPGLDEIEHFFGYVGEEVRTELVRSISNAIRDGEKPRHSRTHRLMREKLILQTNESRETDRADPRRSQRPSNRESQNRRPDVVRREGFSLVVSSSLTSRRDSSRRSSTSQTDRMGRSDL